MSEKYIPEEVVKQKLFEENKKKNSSVNDGDLNETMRAAYARAGFSDKEIKDYEELVTRLDPEEADGMTLVDRDPDDEERLRKYTSRLLK